MEGKLFKAEATKYKSSGKTMSVRTFSQVYGIGENKLIR